MRVGAMVLVAGLAAAPAAPAQDWNWQFAPYLWGSSIGGEAAIGPVERDVDVEFAEILDVLSGAFLFHVEGGNGEHGFLANLVWMEVEPDDDIATVGGVASMEFDAVISELGYLRSFDRLGLELGARYWDMDLEIDPALIGALARGDTWVDGWAGIRIERALGDRWSVTSRLNAGAGGSDSSFGLSAQFGRAMSSGNRLLAGFKVLGVDYVEDSGGLPLALDTQFMGATIGYLFD